MPREWLQKLIAQAGVASRRAAIKLIEDGRVTLNGVVVRELGAKADLKTDIVEVQGHGRLSAEPLVYIALYKPVNVVTTMRDPEGRTTVLEVLAQSRALGKRRFEGELPRVYPVGRLDFDAEGLLLLTNDGELSHNLTHPRMHVPKTYAVKVKGRPESEAIERLAEGVRLRNPDGTHTRRTGKAKVRILKRSPANTWIELVITEGMHHQVKRMCEAVRCRVLRLVRIDFGGIPLEPLEPGAWRFLTEAEVASLKASATRH